MNLRSLLLPAAALLALVTGCASSGSSARAGKVSDASVSYRVSVPDPAAEKFHVTGTLRKINRDTIDFLFPIWGPGAYDIVKFGQYVSDFTATSGEAGALRVERLGTDTFRIIGARGDVDLAYHVRDIEAVDNSAWFGLSDIEPDLAFANTPALFGYPAGYKDIPYDVDYKVPSGWDITVGLDKEGSRYTAADYDELVDAPVQMGKFQRFEFQVKGKPHIITITAPEEVDEAEVKGLIDSARKIVTVMSDFFGEMPYKQYIFQYYLVQPREGDFLFGALEHRNSSTYRMPYTGTEIAQGLAHVTAHEYWHTWSPKRIHVNTLGPFDYQNPPRTRSLWFAEGITEYYAKVLMARTGMSPVEEFLNDLDGGRKRYGESPQRESMTDLSYKIAEVPTMQILDLYSKGPLLAFLLDAEIRLQTGNKKSLDDAMRFFNEKFGRTGESFTDEEIIPLMEEATGAELTDFYGQYISGREPLPFSRILGRVGLAVLEKTESVATFGAEFEGDAKGWRVSKVRPGGPFDKMGLKVGDVLTELLGTNKPFLFTNIPVEAAPYMAAQIPPAGLSLAVDRGGSRVETPIVLEPMKVTVQVLGMDENATGMALEIRRGILGS